MTDDRESPEKQNCSGNTREDGSYKVGKNRPPEHTRFRAGDGRPRGRRPKGLRNFDTEFEEESRRRITIREAGKERRVTKRQAAIIRTYDNALTKGDARSASLVFSHAVRIGDRHLGSVAPTLPAEDDAELNAWLHERLALFQASEEPKESTEEQDREP